MLYCFSFGFLVITVPFLICNFTLVDNFSQERKTVVNLATPTEGARPGSYKGSHKGSNKGGYIRKL